MFQEVQQIEVVPADLEVLIRQADHLVQVQEEVQELQPEVQALLQGARVVIVEVQDRLQEVPILLVLVLVQVEVVGDRKKYC